MKNFFLLVILVILFILYNASLYAYTFEDLLHDILLLKDPRQNPVQIEATRFRIALYIKRIINSDELFYDFHRYLSDIDAETLSFIISTIKPYLNKEELALLQSKLPDKKITQNNQQKTQTNKTVSDPSIKTIQETNTNNKDQTDKQKPPTTPQQTDTTTKKSDTSAEQKNDQITETTINTNEIKPLPDNKKKYTADELTVLYTTAYKDYQKGNYSTAFINFSICYQSNFNAASCAYYLGIISEKTSDYTNALHYYKSSIALLLTSGSVDFKFVSYVYKKCGIIYIRQKLYDTALTMLNRGLEFFPSDSELYYYSGICYYETKEFSKALESWKKSASMGNILAKERYDDLQKAMGSK